MEESVFLKNGKQLLIEYDAGYISPEENKKALNEIEDMDFSNDIVLYAVLQKYDTPNKNGRIYPEAILKRENEKYQTLIKKGTALNELNHPSCHTGDVDVLTLDGWKNIKELEETETVYTLNSEGRIESKQIYSTVKHEYKDKMIHLKGKDIDTIVTPNHKFLIYFNEEYVFKTAQEIYDDLNGENILSDSFIPKNFKSNLLIDFFKGIGIYLNNKKIQAKEVTNIDDHVYSIDVPNHTYYVRSNGKCHWTGNSSLIDLDRVSHTILETWWEGKILMGKLKLLTSPGWKKMGIVSTKGDQAAMLLMNGVTLGISSRGVGSLKNIKGQNIVQDDFELVCFDLVSSPSTPGAYVFKDLADRDNYQESTEEKPVVLDKTLNLMNKLNVFLNKK